MHRPLPAGEVDLLILDEAVGPTTRASWTGEMLLAFWITAPRGWRWCSPTGTLHRSSSSRADYITEMKKIRHPFEQGIPARLGIEK